MEFTGELLLVSIAVTSGKCMSTHEPFVAEMKNEFIIDLSCDVYDTLIMPNSKPPV